MLTLDKQKVMDAARLMNWDVKSNWSGDKMDIHHLSADVPENECWTYILDPDAGQEGNPWNYPIVMAMSPVHHTCQN